MLEGSCACGSVRYSVNQLSGPVVHCHCRTCQKTHAAPFTSTARVERANFSWLQGEEKLKRFASSPGKTRWFCGECGAHLVAEWADQSSVILRVATLDIPQDQKSEFEVKAHIWTSQDCAWLPYGKNIPDFPKSPQ